MDPLQPVANRCIGFIVNAGTKDGVYPRDLSRYIEAYRKLCQDDRFRVNVLICKNHDVAFSADEDDFRFWPRSSAPEHVRNT